MGRNVVYLVSDDFNVTQKAKTWGVENGCEVKVYSTSQWHSTLSSLSTASSLRLDGVVLTGGNQNTGSGTGGRVINFPGSNPTQQAAGKKVASMDEVESHAIQAAIAEYKGNLTEAAKALGIGRATLYRKVKQYNIDPSVARNKTPKAA